MDMSNMMDIERRTEITVPSLEHVDAELNVMSMLAFIMREHREILSVFERERIAEWFGKRYGDEYDESVDWGQ